jgi:hypothetical protein
LDLSAGLGFGYTAIYTLADMIYLRPSVGISWRPTDKLSISLQGVLEERLFYAPRRKWMETPVFTASISYEPTTTTTLTLGANRTVAPSFFASQVVENTSWSASLSQRLLQHLQLSGGVDSQTADYISSTDSQAIIRSDELHSYNVRLATTFLRRGSLSFSYRYTNNTSNLTGFGISNRQLAGQIGFRY